MLSLRKLRLQDMIDGLRRARHDDRVRVLVAKVGGGHVGLARIQEIRQAVEEFRRAGKLAVAWAETFGEFARGTCPTTWPPRSTGSTCSPRAAWG